MHCIVLCYVQGLYIPGWNSVRDYVVSQLLEGTPLSHW